MYPMWFVLCFPIQIYTFFQKESFFFKKDASHNGINQDWRDYWTAVGGGF